MAAVRLQLRLADNADIVAVQRLFDEAREAGHRGDEIRIHCDDAICFDVGALQLLGSLLAEVQSAQLQFTTPQHAGVLTRWLKMVA